MLYGRVVDQDVLGRVRSGTVGEVEFYYDVRWLTVSVTGR